MPEVFGDWRGDLTGWGTLEDKGKFIGVGCLWTGDEAGGAGVGKLHGKEPSEMDLGAALLVLAAPKSNQACHGPRTRSLSASPTSVQPGFSPAVRRQGGPVLSCGLSAEDSWMRVETSTVQRASHERARSLIQILRGGEGLTREPRAQQRLRDVTDLFEGYVDAGDYMLHHRRPSSR